MTTPIHAVLKVEDVVGWVKNLLIRLDSAKDVVGASQERYRGLGVSWEADKDFRCGWFATVTGQVLLYAQIELMTLRDRVSDPSWWPATFNFTLGEPSHFALMFGYEARVRWTTLHTLYVVTEDFIRRVSEATDQGFYKANSRSIARITDHLLEMLGLQGFKELFRLARTIRNTIHNDGVFRPDSGKDQTIEWNSRTYMFTVGEAVTVTNWDFLLEHIRDLNDAVREIVLHEKVLSLPPHPGSWGTAIP